MRGTGWSGSGPSTFDVTVTTADPRVQRALEHIDRNLDRPIHLAELATVAGVERKHFSRLFQRSTGWRCAELIRCRRVARARRLLLDGPGSIAGVAADVGWDVRTLQRVFRAYCGSTPEEFRDTATVAAQSRLLFPLLDPGARSRGTPGDLRERPRTDARRRSA